MHLSEEVRRSRHAVPRVVFWTIAINACGAYAITLVLLFSLGDIQSVLSAPFPIIEIIQQATGSTRTATAMVCGLLVISVTVTLGTIASASRLTWAWARDGGLPAYFSHISTGHRIPIRSIWLPVLIVMALACLNIASYAAFGAFIALSTLALYVSYFIAIACMLRARLTRNIQFGGWNLGRYGVAINCYALVYTAWMGIFVCFPQYLPVSGDNMNYASPIFGFVVIAALLLWVGYARKHWPGLNKEVIDLVLADSDRATKD